MSVSMPDQPPLHPRCIPDSRTPTGSLVLDRSIPDGDLARGIHAFLCESKQSDVTFILMQYVCYT